MSSLWVQTVIPAHFFVKRLYSVTGVFPLFLFLCLQFYFALMLLFGSKESVQQIIGFQSHVPVAVLEMLLISIPLLFHFLYGISMILGSQLNVHHYGFGANIRFTMQRFCGIVIFVFLLFHLYYAGQTFSGNLEGYQYIQEMLLAHSSITGMMVYWMVMMCMAFYFFNGLWSFLIDWGVAGTRMAQRVFLTVLMIKFILLTLLIVFIMLYQIIIKYR